MAVSLKDNQENNNNKNINNNQNFVNNQQIQNNHQIIHVHVPTPIPLRRTTRVRYDAIRRA
jgi:hypothetical protein